MEKDESSEPTAAPDHASLHPTLPYQSLDPEVLQPRPPRRTIPKKFGIAFFATAMPLCIFWLFLDAENILLPHAAIYVVAIVATIGIGMSFFERLRLAAAGVLIAVALWFLLLGGCYLGTGFGVRPLSF